MNKSALLLILILPILTEYSYAQSGSDPMHWTAPIKVRADNIFLMYSRVNSNDTALVSHQKLFDYSLANTDSTPLNDRLVSTKDHVSPIDTVNNNEHVDVASGYLTGSVFENVVEAWDGPDNTIQIMIPHFDSTKNAWSNSSEMTVPGPETGRRIYVRTGDFLGNGLDQFVLAYFGADLSIHLQVYSVDDSLDPHLIASINDVKYSKLYPIDINPFSITTGDLNDNGKDEIILSYRAVDSTGDAPVFLKVYEVDNDSIQSEGSLDVIAGNGPYQAPEFGITAGHFKGDNLDQIALVWASNQSGTNNAEVFTLFYQVSTDLSTITKKAGTFSFISTGGSLIDFSIASGDLDNGGRDELVYDLDDRIYVDSTNNLMNKIVPVTNFGSPRDVTPVDDQLSYDFLAVGDLDNSGNDAVVVEKDIYGYGNGSEHWTEIKAFKLLNDMTIKSVIADVRTDTSADNGAGSYYHSALALGAFKGDNLSVGPPQFYTVNNVVQPVVVLNTPPVHFDILHGYRYDLSNCFSGNGCSFYSTYEQQSSTSVNLETQTHNDVSDAYGLDLSGSVGINIKAVSFSANFELKIEKTYGQSFASNTSTTKTTSLQIGVSAKGDDQVYATTSSYNLWVYPVYRGNDPAPVNFLNFVSPVETLGAWYPIKTYAANDYMPNHEVGNVLSYLPSDSAMHNPNIDSSIVSISQSQGLPISGQSNSYWDFDYSQYKESSLDSTWNSGWDVNINLGLAYSKTSDNVQEKTNTISIMNGWDLRSNFGALDSSLGLGGADGYTVYPYAYRSKQGAVVLTYAVDPDTASPGQPPTWWQQEYGHNSDPTFILPWFYAEQEGSPADTVKKYETSDITFSNYNPQPGDIITVTARVRNFSLVPTPMPVTVKFYVGSPDSGGTVITGTNGIDSVVTAKAIPSRYWSNVSMRWLVPSGLPQYPRIYAVIDPSNQIKEVHESNNMGWAVLGPKTLSSVSGIMQPKEPVVPKSPVLYQSYPNPFNPTSQIDYSIPKQEFLTITIYNILGQRVKTLFSGIQSAGMHAVTFNGEPFASGVYFYRLQAGNYANTKKMILLK